VPKLIRFYCVPTPTQHAITPGSVNEYQQKLGSKQAYNAIHWPRISSHPASAGVWPRANYKEISAPYGHMRLGKVFAYFFIQHPMTVGDLEQSLNISTMVRIAAYAQFQMVVIFIGIIC